MCGIFGTSDYNENTELIIDYLAYEMEDRGKDSWGITNGKQVFKRMGYATATFEVPESWTQMIGHCRATSVGKTNIQNQHPFEFRSHKGTLLVGIHNGTLSNHRELNTKHNRDFDVDTKHLFAHLAEDKPFNDIRGSAVIAFYEDGVLNLGRFNSSSLSVVRLQTGEIIFASTESAVKKAIRAGGGSIATTIPIKEDHIYTYNPVAKTFTCREVEGFASGYVYNYQTSRSPSFYTPGYSSNSSRSGALSKKSAGKTDTPSEPSLISFEPANCAVCKEAVVNYREEVVCADCLSMYEMRLEYDDETSHMRGSLDINYPTGCFDFNDPQDFTRYMDARAVMLNPPGDDDDNIHAARAAVPWNLD